jgi:hypothetical protein
MSIPDTVGSSDASRVDAIVKADPIQVLSGFDVMDHTGLAARTPDRKNRDHHEDAKTRGRKTPQHAPVIDAPASVSELPGP